MPASLQNAQAFYRRRQLLNMNWSKQVDWAGFMVDFMTHNFCESCCSILRFQIILSFRKINHNLCRVKCRKNVLALRSIVGWIDAFVSYEHGCLGSCLNTISCGTDDLLGSMMGLYYSNCGFEPAERTQCYDTEQIVLAQIHLPANRV